MQDNDHSFALVSASFALASASLTLVSACFALVSTSFVLVSASFEPYHRNDDVSLRNNDYCWVFNFLAESMSMSVFEQLSPEPSMSFAVLVVSFTSSSGWLAVATDAC